MSEETPEFRDLRKEYYQVLNSTIPHRINEISTLMEHAVSYAQMAVRGAFITNGGAIIFLPAIVEAGAITVPSAMISSIYFISGLGCAALCSLLAYWNFLMLHDIRQIDLDLETRRLMYSYFPHLDQFSETHNEMVSLSNRRKRKSLFIFPSYVLSIFFGICSYLLFYYGSYILIPIDKIF